MASDADYVNFVRSKYPGLSDAEVMKDAAELKSTGFDLAAAQERFTKLQETGPAAAKGLRNLMEKHIGPVADKTSAALSQGFQALADPITMGVSSANPANVQTTKNVSDNFAKGLNPVESLRTPEGAALTIATPFAARAAGGGGLITRLLGLPAVGAAAGGMTDENPMAGVMRGGAEGFTAGLLASLFRWGMRPDEERLIWDAVKKHAPWAEKLAGKHDQDSLRKLASWGDPKTPGSGAYVAGQELDKVEAGIRSHKVAGQPLGDMVFDVPMAWDVNALRPRGQTITQGVNGTVSVKVNDALKMIRQAKGNPETQAAAYEAEKNLVDQLNNADRRFKLGDVLMEGSKQFKAVSDAGRLIADAIKLASQTSSPLPGGVSIPLPGKMRMFEPGALLGQPEKDVTIRKIGAALRSPQEQGSLGGHLRFDEHQGFNPYFDLPATEAAAQAKIVPAIVGIEAQNLARESLKERK